MPPKKGRRHVLRVIREILFFEPKHKGTRLNVALDFLSRVTRHRAIAVVLSDFLDESAPTPGTTSRPARGASSGRATIACSTGWWSRCLSSAMDG